MSFESNRPEYLRMMASLVSRQVPAKDFVASFHRQWMADCNEEHAAIEEWDERYDLYLLDAFHGGKMGIEELGARMRAIHCITDSQNRARELIHRAMLSCDLFRPGPLKPDADAWEVDEAILHREISVVFESLRNWRDE